MFYNVKKNCFHNSKDATFFFLRFLKSYGGVTLCRSASESGRFRGSWLPPLQWWNNFSCTPRTLKKKLRSFETSGTTERHSVTSQKTGVLLNTAGADSDIEFHPPVLVLAQNTTCGQFTEIPFPSCTFSLISSCAINTGPRSLSYLAKTITFANNFASFVVIFIKHLSLIIIIIRSLVLLKFIQAARIFDSILVSVRISVTSQIEALKYSTKT